MSIETIDTGLPGESLPDVVTGPRSFSWWGMVLFICTEATLFGLLIASYFYLRFRAGPVWPPDGIPMPKLGTVLVMTPILLGSSIPVHLADRAVRKGHMLRARFGFLLGWLMGTTFLAIQLVKEYPETLKIFTPRTDVYGSLFFSLTGLHGIHVLVGLLMGLWVQVRLWKGAFDAERHVSVQNFSMYWHFVDVVWIFVFTTIYLTPHF
jgi:heme/copper-type cytochrome/quinol oxidase subunit 3